MKPEVADQTWSSPAHTTTDRWNRLWRFCWLTAVGAFLFFSIWPPSLSWTRLGGLVSFTATWIGFFFLARRQPVLRWLLSAVTVVGIVFLSRPGNARVNTREIRKAYVLRLLSYQNTRYVYGGENAVGIDCSGLVRRCFVEALLVHGLRTMDAEIVREAGRIWWTDGSAEGLAHGAHGRAQIVEVFPRTKSGLITGVEAPGSIAGILLAGDMAIVNGGSHVLAYLGGNCWIEADPGPGKVVTRDGPTLHGEVTIVRWRVIAQPAETAKDFAIQDRVF